MPGARDRLVHRRSVAVLPVERDVAGRLVPDRRRPRSRGQLDVGDQRFRFIAGQDWSVVTPRLPTSLSHTVVAAHSFSGAVWGRLPQVTFAFRQPFGGADSRLGEPAFTLKISAARHFSGDGFGGGITRFDRPDPGTLSLLPVAQMHVGIDSKVLSIGVGGHLGRETHQVARLAEDGSLIKGRLGENMDLEAGQAAARRCGIMLLAQMKAALGSLDRVERVVKLGVFVNSHGDFTDQPKVANGASELMQDVFGEAGRHARSAVGVPVLPLGVAVEVDAIVQVKA